MSTKQSQDAGLDAKSDAHNFFTITQLKERRLARIRSDNPSRLGLFQKIYAGKQWRSEAIKGFCLDCMGFDSVAIRECGDHLCPLHKFRPFQGKAKL